MLFCYILPEVLRTLEDLKKDFREKLKFDSKKQIDTINMHLQYTIHDTLAKSFGRSITRLRGIYRVFLLLLREDVYMHPAEIYANLIL